MNHYVDRLFYLLRENRLTSLPMTNENKFYMDYNIKCSWTLLVAQLVKNLSVMRERSGFNS